jgi:hypothetical protein
MRFCVLLGVARIELCDLTSAAAVREVCVCDGLPEAPDITTVVNDLTALFGCSVFVHWAGPSVVADLSSSVLDLTDLLSDLTSVFSDRSPMTCVRVPA